MASTWDDLYSGLKWPCGHAKTVANTYQAGRTSAKCLTCKRDYSRDYQMRFKERDFVLGAKRIHLDQVKLPKRYSDFTPAEKRTYHLKKQREYRLK
jgi:hypothetical protein